MAKPVIEVRGLSVGYAGRNGQAVSILRGIDLALRQAETIGLVGESGSGKSTLALAMMGFLKSGLSVLGGSTWFRDRDTFALDARGLEEIRGGDLALIPQNAGQALTPTMRIGTQIMEALRLHSTVSAAGRKDRAVELLRQVRLPSPETLVTRYPHELSGGQQQRVAIAMALAGEPNALLLDEPTTGLDVTTQAHVLALLRDLTRSSRTAMVYVSHDLGAVAQVCQRVAVMYAGEIVLLGPAAAVLRNPCHPYARGLIASIPRLSSPALPAAMEGRPPQPGTVGAGCAFADRCPQAESRCRSETPVAVATADGQVVRCHFHDRVAAHANAISDRSRAGRARATPAAAAPLLSVRGLAISYTKPNGLAALFGRATDVAATVDGVGLEVARGETIGLVGESGSGKSTILKAIAGLVSPRAGAIGLEQVGLLGGTVTDRASSELRRIQLIFQNPDDSLNPRQTVGEILAKPLQLYFKLTREAVHAESIALLERVRLGAHYLDRLPGQLSGGEKQRVAIARAFAAKPDIVLCDEVTSALDVSVQAAVLDLLDRLRAEQQVAYIFVSHDLAVVRAIADRVIVLYQGRICEAGPAAKVYAPPFHPYTEALLGAVLEPDPDHVPRLLGEDVVERSPPLKGCPFQRRCHRRVGSICETEIPPAQQLGEGHVVHCHIPLAVETAGTPAAANG